MKTSIKLVALFLFMFLGTGAFASIHVKSYHKANNTTSQVSLVPLKHSRGFALMVDKSMPGNSMVIIYNSAGDGIFKHQLKSGLNNETKYLTTELQDGQYTVEVYSKGHDVKTNFYIYNSGSRRIEDIN
ncbi:MAG: hypothetical protein JST50_13800 [Bacteroidetes bacterium]|jgi:hypothetical protein|nr:hypothetical protein [Bacteroidota bacterium]